MALAAEEHSSSEWRTFTSGPGAHETEHPSAPRPPQATAPLLTAGEIIHEVSGGGSYQIVRPLPRGGMARVFLARRMGAAGFVHQVALKCLAEDWGVEEQARRAFAYEAKLQGLIDSPNVVRATDLIEFGGRYFLVLEYVEGASLKTILRVAQRQHRDLGKSFCSYVAASVADGLHDVHGAALDGKPLGIVHRDVKPANIMIAVSGIVKMLDFGVASARMEGRDHTRTGTIKGTYPYSSPEQASHRDLDRRSDLFSLGVVLVELLTGRHPFAGGSDFEIIDRIRHVSVADVNDATREIPPGLREICRKALAAAPGDRFQSGAEFAGALRAYLREQDLPSYGPKDCVADVPIEAFSEHATPGAPSSAPTDERPGAILGEAVTSGTVPGSDARRSRLPLRRVAWRPRVALAALLAGAGLLGTWLLSRHRAADPSTRSTPGAHVQAEDTAPVGVTNMPPVVPQPERPAMASPDTPLLTGPVVRPRKKKASVAPTAPKAQAPELPRPATESLPRNTRILARLVSAIDAKRPGPVRAVVDADVLQNGVVLVPSGTPMTCRSTGSELEPTIEGFAANARVKVRCEAITAAGRTWLFGGYAIGQDGRDSRYGLLAVGGSTVPAQTLFTVYAQYER